jgi:hypothetical protein
VIRKPINATIFAAAISAAAGCSGVAVAQVAAAPGILSAAASAQLPGSDPNHLICKTLAPITGTRIGERQVCRTQRQWDDDADLAKQQIQTYQSVPMNMP